MKLLVELEDEGHIYTLELRKLFRLLGVEVSEDEILGKVLSEIRKT